MLTFAAMTAHKLVDELGFDIKRGLCQSSPRNIVHAHKLYHYTPPFDGMTAYKPVEELRAWYRMRAAVASPERYDTCTSSYDVPPLDGIVTYTKADKAATWIVTRPSQPSPRATPYT